MLKLLRNRFIQRSQIKCMCSTTKNDKTNLPEKRDVPELAKSFDQKSVTVDSLKWRTPWHKQHGHLYNSLRVFYTEKNHTSLLQWVQQPINLSPKAIKNWWVNKQEEMEIAMQSYLPSRNQMLGNELAAAHFIVHRGGAVKFYNEDNWIKADRRGDYTLPRYYEEGKILQAIDCSDMKLYYEGLANLRDLKNVEWLSFNGCSHIDDWCLDSIANSFNHSLIYLDLRDCPKITENGIGALYKLRKLKMLYLDDLLLSTKFELTCLLLQEANPNLDIRSEEIK